MTKKQKIIVAAVTLGVILVSGLSWLIAELVIYKGTPSDTVWTSEDEFDAAAVVRLAKQADKDFVILNITDVQFGDTLDGPWNKTFTENTVSELVKKTNPDLITVTGDMVWTRFSRHSFKRFVEFMEGLGIPWAPVFGNHDGEGNSDLNRLGDLLEQADNCLFEKGPGNIGGVGNYVLAIEQDGRIVHSLIMMDTHSSRTYEETGEWGYDHVYPDQIKWYEWVIDGIAGINGGEPVTSTLFMHIPLYEYAVAYEQWAQGGFDESTGFGRNNEPVCCPPVNNGFFDVIKAAGSTRDVVVGHDHINYSSVLYEGVRLTYGLKTGDRCYHDDSLNGGTVLTLNARGEVRTEHVYITF